MPRQLFPTALLLSALAAHGSAQDVVLNEFVAANSSGLQDESGSPSPWIELHNRAAVPVAVGGLRLEYGQAAWWALPSGTSIPAGGHLVVFADGEPFDGPLHASFVLGEFASSLRLVERDGSRVLDTLDYTDQKADVATGRQYDGQPRWISILDPTPGTANTPAPGEFRRFDAFDPFKHFLLHGVEGNAVSGGQLTFAIGQAPPDSTLLWYFSPTTIDFGFPSGQSVLLVGLEFPAVPIPIGSDGRAQFSLHVPNAPQLVGLTLFTQGFVLQQYFKGSNALELVLGG